MLRQTLTSLEICAGAGGQALGLAQAGFMHTALVELDPRACETLRTNRPEWEVIERDLRALDGKEYRGIDLLAGGVPCPPFSVAGRQLGPDDDRDLFPVALRLIDESRPLAVMLENVPGLATARFADYRKRLAGSLSKLGYIADWQVLNACNYGVPQLRPRFILVAFKHKKSARHFAWPPASGTPPTVGEKLIDLMACRGWTGAGRWAAKAKGIGPTLVGGSKLHGGPDVGPTRARKAWHALGVDGRTIAEEAPGTDFPVSGYPRLTVRMGARIQGFPDAWQLVGRKTAAWRQVGNAFPPPIAKAVGTAIRQALLGEAVAVPEAEQFTLPFRIA